MKHEFIGYVVTDQNAEYYLEKVDIKPNDCGVIYVNHPRQARIIKSVKIAYELTKLIGQFTKVYRLYETSDHYAIGNITEDDIYTIVRSKAGVKKNGNVYRLF